MEQELALETKKGKNVKLGYGGLADIEFTAQVLQLMHGYSYPQLRATNTLEVLRLLSKFGIINFEEAEGLISNYLFLRNLECALRLYSEKSENYLPKDNESLERLARLLGYKENSREVLASELLKAYEKQTGQVRTFYSNTLDKLLRTFL